MSTLRALVFAFALTAPIGSIAAQHPITAGNDARLPTGARLVDLAVRVFGKSDGLQSPTVYAVAVDLNARLWIGTEIGPMRFDGNRWLLQNLPAEITARQTRAILQSADSSMWFATRSGVVRSRGVTQTVFDVRNGLPGAVVYSIIETRALNGQAQVLVGTGAGVAVFDGKQFHALALPESLKPEGLMLGETRAPDGTLELWLASSLGRVGRYAKGQWTVFGVAEGLTSRSAEAVTPIYGDPRMRLVVPGEGGVFAFRDDGPRGARFELIAGSPRRSYRVVELARADGARELWVGTLDGVVQRYVNAGWETVDVASMPQGGRVTALTAVPGHAGGTAVYVGTYGGRLARIAVGSVGTLEVRGGTRRDVLISIAAERAANGRTTLWMGTRDLGLFHLDEFGRTIEYSRTTGQTFNSVPALALLSSLSRVANYRDTTGDRADLWIATDRGPYRREGARLVPKVDGIEGRIVRSFARGPLSDGTIALVAATDSGLFRWTNRKWKRVPAFGAEPIVALASATVANEPLLWVATPQRFARVTEHEVVFDSPSAVASSSTATPSDTRLPPKPGAITALCGFNGATSTGRVFAGNVYGDLWWRDPHTQWMPVPVELLRAIARDQVRRLACLEDGRLVIGTALGLIIVNVRDVAPSRWSVLSVTSQEDGLPATEIDAIAPMPVDGNVWVGTTRGVGALQLNRIALPPTPVLDVRLSSESPTGPVQDGDELRAGDLRVSIKPVLVTNHREYDTRYRVHLYREGDAQTEMDTTTDGIADTSAWTADPEARYQSLSTGNYTLHVWARDYAGRVAESPATHFRVVPPLWRSWWAILSYALFLAGAIYVAHRQRLRTLERTNKRLANSERRMRASERKFRALFDEASDAHLLIDGSTVSTINLAARSLLQLNTTTVDAGATSHELQHILPQIPWRELKELASSGAAGTFEFELHGGASIPVSAQITQVPLDDRTLWHLVLRDLRSTRDAEEVRLRLEDQVRDAQKLESLGTLAGGVAHDFNNLLGVIQGNVELARDMLHDTDAVAVHLDTVFDASERARDLVRQILTFSRRSSSREEIVDVAQLLRHLQPMLRSMIPSSVEIVIAGAESPTLVQGDPTQLQQVLLNLASNAEYAMRPKCGGRLSISLESARTAHGVRPSNGFMVCLRVTDTGIGMSPEVLERVFEPFYTTKPTGDGTGLGMAVLHGIVASHGGCVNASSVLGESTTFEVLLPSAAEMSIASLSQVHPTTASVEHSVVVAPVPAPLSRAFDEIAAVTSRIVLVDDEPSVARVSETALTRMGFHVTVFAEPGAALEFVRTNPDDVDLVITDQTMPGFTGDVLALELHRIRAELPVIIVSGFSYVLTAERLEEVGALAVLQKPVSLATLRTAVESALRAPVAGLVA
ncbi:MAG: ATP-binding protein [Gemmatimonas sp.]